MTDVAREKVPWPRAEGWRATDVESEDSTLPSEEWPHVDNPEVLSSVGRIDRRTTPDLIAEMDVVVGKTFWRCPGTTLVVCVLHLRNGAVAVGDSGDAYSDYDDLNRELLAEADAYDKVWALVRYAVRQRRWEQGT